MKKLLFGLLGMLVCHSLLGAFKTDHPLIKGIIINRKPVDIPSDNTLELKKENSDLIINLDTLQSGDTLLYQLEGFDKQPLTSTVPQIRYTNLPGGYYKLDVSLINAGRHTSKDFELNINKEKFWWEEVWSFLAIIFSVLVVSFTFAFMWTIYYRWQQRKEQRMRDQISSDLHDEVGSSLSSIAFSIKSLERKVKIKAPETLPIIDDIYASSSTSIENLRDAVWVINPKNDSIGELLDKMRSFAFMLLPAAEIKLEFDNVFDHLGKDPNKLKINNIQRRNSYLMFKETLNNVVKHAQAKTVVVKIERETNGVKIFIKDDGIGMDLSKEYKGIGIKNFKKRAKESLIDLQLVSQPGEGTAITMMIPEL